MGTRSPAGDAIGAYTTPTEWKLWNQSRLSQSQLERLTAERLVAESKRLRDDVGNRVTSSRREASFPSPFVSFFADGTPWPSMRLSFWVMCRLLNGAAQVSQQFSSRIRDLQYWRTNLDNKTAETAAEIDSLIQCQSMLQRMYHSCAGQSFAPLDGMNERQSCFFAIADERLPLVTILPACDS